MPWTKRITKPIPNIRSREVSLELNDYSGGFNSFVSNDKFPVRDGGINLWRLAQDARILTLGEYETRKGFDYHSDAAGETKDDSQESTTGAADRSFNSVTRLAQKVTTSAAGRLPKLEPRLKNDEGATGVILVEYWTDDSGAPGTLITRSSVAPNDVTGSYAYMPTRYPDVPTLAVTTDYWMICYVQTSGSGSYKWSSTSSGSNALVSTDSGVTWSSTSYDLNFKQYYCTDSPPKGLFRGYKSDGTKVTLFAHGTSLYKVNEVTGALTAIKTGLSANATEYRFFLVNDIIYYVNGYDGLRKWDFTTESQVNATNYTHITVYKGLLFLVKKDDPQTVVYSNFGEYETFTSTDFITVPAPKTGDPVTALNPLSYLIISTRDGKYILSGDDNATFSLDPAPDTKGTYTQETTALDGNFMYYLSEDGVYKSNGTEPQLLSENCYEEIRSLANKDDCCLAVNKGRLYLWYREDGSAVNNKCKVWNLNYGGGADSIESDDTNAYVCRALTAFRDDDELLVASSLIGQVYWQEKSTNDYTNLGGDINFELTTHYFTFGSPAVLKEIRDYRPRFAAQDGNYALGIYYAYDLRDNWALVSDVDVQGAGTLWGSGETWGSFTWGATAEVQASVKIPGQHRRTALRYKHYATRQPHKFLGHSFRAQLRRLK